MTTNYAKFDQERYDKYDGVAKDALVSYLTQEGHAIKRVKEDYLADVVSTKEGETFYSEAEVKAVWKGEWPENWKDLRIPGRKVRLLQKQATITFFVFRADFKECWIVKGEQLSLDNLKPAYGAKITKGEMFFHIPVTEAKLIRYDQNSWAQVVQEDAGAEQPPSATEDGEAETLP